jgi:outer membrane protein assembly factor BamD (BamD/ComL family)
MNRILIAFAAAAVIFSGCSKPSAEEYFDKGQKARELAQHQADTLKNQVLLPGLYQPSIDEFEKLVNAYPTSAQAETAMFIVASIRTNETHQPDLAVVAYKKYLQLFPAGKQAPLAGFMIGYLYNNELHELDSARVAYTRFLEKFPDHEMAASAKFELENLGKSPEELIPKEPPPTAKTAKKSGKRK